MYRHALPPGFVLKKDKKKEEKTESISIEELIEDKRAELSAKTDLTPVTLETFLKWKKRKLQEKADKEEKEADKKKDKAKAGITLGLSGREMFSFNPKMVGDEVRALMVICKKLLTFSMLVRTMRRKVRLST